MPKAPGLVAAQRQERSNLEEWWHPEKGVADPEILERRRRVAICWNQLGLTVKDTAARLGCSTSTVASDRRWLLEAWQKSVQADVVEIVSRELAKLEEQESQLWQAWEDSKSPEIQTTTEKMAGPKGRDAGSVERVRTTNRSPEPRYMELILKCQERRSKLLGLDKAVTFEGAAFSFAVFVDEAWKRNRELKRNKPKPLDVTPPEALPDESDSSSQTT